MKRYLIVLMILGLVAGSMTTAEAKRTPKRVERTVEGSYNGPFVPFTTGCPSSMDWGCVAVVTRANEAFFTAEVSDAHGQPVPLLVTADLYGHPDDHETTYGYFCGETTEPVAFEPGADLYFWVGFHTHHSLECRGPIASTIGTVSVTLSNLP